MCKTRNVKTETILNKLFRKFDKVEEQYYVSLFGADDFCLSLYQKRKAINPQKTLDNAYSIYLDMLDSKVESMADANIIKKKQRNYYLMSLKFEEIFKLKPNNVLQVDPKKYIDKDQIEKDFLKIIVTAEFKNYSVVKKGEILLFEKQLVDSILKLLHSKCKMDNIRDFIQKYIKSYKVKPLFFGPLKHTEFSMFLENCMIQVADLIKDRSMASQPRISARR